MSSARSDTDGKGDGMPAKLRKEFEGQLIAQAEMLKLDVESALQYEEKAYKKWLAERRLRNRVDVAVKVEQKGPAFEMGAVGYMAKAMVQATLPHQAVKGNEFTRVNGNYRLTLQSPSHIGLPYGALPRLILAWVTSEAVKTGKRELELGDSMAAFMRELGIWDSTGGKNGSITRLKTQARRLFASTITASYDCHGGSDDIGYKVADRTMLWWNTQNPNQAGLWKSTVTLSEPFFNEITTKPIPIDLRVLQQLKNSPLAIDIYMMLTHRYSYLTKPVTIPWHSLSWQLGADYKEIRKFRTAFVKALKRVQIAYKDASAFVLDDHEGLLLMPSLPSVKKTKERKLSQKDL